MPLANSLKFLRYFMPAYIDYSLDTKTKYRLASLISSLLISLFISITALITSFSFDGPMYGKILFFLIILGSFSFLIFIKVSNFNLDLKIKGISYLISIIVIICLGISNFFNIGFGYFINIFIFPIIIMFSSIYSRKVFSLLFILILIGLLSIGILNYDQLISPVNEVKNFKMLYIVYLIISLLSIYMYILINLKQLEEFHVTEENKFNQEDGQTKYHSLVTLLSYYAHEINNPLFRIQAKIDILKTSFENGTLTKEEFEYQAEVIENTIQSLSTINKKLSSFAKEGIASNMSLINLDVIFRDVLDMVKDKMINNDSTIEYFIENEIELITFHQQLYQSLIISINLLLNITSKQSAKHFYLNAVLENNWIEIELKLNDNLRLSFDDLQNEAKKDSPFLMRKKEVNHFMTINNLIQDLDGRMSTFANDEYSGFIFKLPTYDDEE